jgi:hypothetical protein
LDISVEGEGAFWVFTLRGRGLAAPCCFYDHPAGIKRLFVVLMGRQTFGLIINTGSRHVNLRAEPF